MKKLLTYLFIGVLFIVGMTNVSAVTVADMDYETIDLSAFESFKINAVKYPITIKNLDGKDYKVYYQLLNVTDKENLAAKFDNFKNASEKYNDLKKRYEEADNTTKEALEPQLNAAETEKDNNEKLYYEQLTNDALYKEANFLLVTNLEQTFANNLKEGNSYVLWVKVVASVSEKTETKAGEGTVEGTTEETFYNQVYFTVEKAAPAKKEEPKEEGPVTNPDTMVANPYAVVIPVLLVAGLGTVVLKNRYNH